MLSRRHKIQKLAEHVFQTKGEPLSDADYHARKSVMLTRVDIGGFGALDLYSTHMHSGGDIPDLGINNIPSEPTKQAVRLAQCDELVSFVKSTHDPRNVAIVVGDYNIDARTGDAGRKMGEANLVDLWHEQYSSQKAGPTIGDFHRCCPKRVRRRVVALEPCDETQSSPSDPGQRVDYVWIEPPQSSQSFNLDASPVARMPFTRESTRDMDFLSDHIGLATTLMACRI